MINFTELELASILKTIVSRKVPKDRGKTPLFEFYLYIAGYYVTVQNLCYYGFFPTPVTDMEKVPQN